MNATEFWYYLRALGACQEAKDWVIKFEERSIEDIFDALALENRDWLHWLLIELYKSAYNERINALYRQYQDWTNTDDFVSMRDEMDRRRDATYIIYNRTDMNSFELDEQLDQMYAEIHQKYAHIWPPFKASIRADLLAELEAAYEHRRVD